MKCPKCRYLSFEPELRCKHCGYDFALAAPDLEMRPAEPVGVASSAPAADLRLRPATLMEDRPAVALSRTRPEPPKVFRRAAPVPAPAPAPAPVPAAAAVAVPDLPLFLSGAAGAQEMPKASDDVEPAAPQVPAAPRPLVVRRATDATRYLRRVETDAAASAFPSATKQAPASAPASNAVPPSARLAAGAIDALVVVVVNLTVFLLTLRQCGLGLAEMASVPLVPLVSFLVSLTAAYLLMFTVVSGQTIGKMIMGLRVVGETRDAEMPTMRQMTYRALLVLPSVLALGLGYMPALVGQGRALHDRLTHTRVVRV